MGETIEVTRKDLHTGGSIVWWTLQGYTTEQAMAEAWKKFGVIECPPPMLPSVEQALARALDDQKQKRRLVRPLTRRGSWMVEDEEVIGNGHDQELKYHPRVKITLAAGDQIVFDPPNGQIQDQISAAFKIHMNSFSTDDVSFWLINTVVPLVDGVALRDRGALYFVPEAQLPVWKHVTEAVAFAGGHKIWTLAQIMDPDHIEAILAAVERETDETLEAIDQKVEDGKIGRRGMETQQRILEAAEAKLARYESAMGSKLDDFRQKLSDVQGRLAAALLLEYARLQKKDQENK